MSIIFIQKHQNFIQPTISMKTKRKNLKILKFKKMENKNKVFRLLVMDELSLVSKNKDFCC